MEKLETDGTIPTNAEVMAATGLAETAVKDHLKSLKGNTERFAKFRMLTDEVIMGMYRAGKGGDARAGKFYAQFVEGWVEEKKVNQVNVNPYAGQTDDDLRKKLAERLAKMRPKESPGDPPAA